MTVFLRAPDLTSFWGLLSRSGPPARGGTPRPAWLFAVARAGSCAAAAAVLAGVVEGGGSTRSTPAVSCLGLVCSILCGLLFLRRERLPCSGPSARGGAPRPTWLFAVARAGGEAADVSGRAGGGGGGGISFVSVVAVAAVALEVMGIGDGLMDVADTTLVAATRRIPRLRRCRGEAMVSKLTWRVGFGGDLTDTRAGPANVRGSGSGGRRPSRISFSIFHCMNSSSSKDRV